MRIYFPKVDFLPSFSLSSWILPIVFTLLVIALSAPFSYSSLQSSSKKGRNLVLALDASGSMEGTIAGSEKSKFEALKTIIKEFLTNRYDDNIAIVLFGSFAYIASPLTYDLHALGFILDYLDTGIAGNNTAIGEAIHQAVQAIKAQKARQNAIVLITDGHHNSGAISPKAAVQEAKREKIKIYTIALGDADKTLLQTIAKESGGKYFFVSKAQELQEVFNELDRLEPSPIRGETYLHKRALFGYFVAAALVLLLWWARKRV